MKRFVVDPSWLRCGGVVFAGSPVTKFVLTERGRNVALAIEQGEEIGPDTLVERLAAVGAIHPLPNPGMHDLSEVTAVIPALVSTSDELDSLCRLVAALGSVHRVIVVDDYSPIDLGNIAGATVLRTPSRLGPAGARNLGLHEVNSSFVLFVDTDVEISGNAVQSLLDHMVADDIALVAPRILTTRSNDMISRYEHTRSPLDMGDVEANVRKRTRVSYVPSTTWLCRTAAMLKIGGFNETLLTGEDVDVVWRLADARFVVRYEPGITVSHRARPNLKRFITQRVGYGESAAPLATIHGDALAPLRMNPVVLGAWITALFSPITAALIFVSDVVRLTRALANTPEERKAFGRLATRNLAHSATLLARAITRVWWPLALVLAVFSKRARVVLALASLLPAAIDWSKDRPALDPLRYAALRILDDASYGIGVWRGVFRHKQIQPLSIALGRDTRYREGR